MTVVLAPPAPSRFAWLVDSLTRASGVAEVQRDGDRLRLMVADGGRSAFPASGRRRQPRTTRPCDATEAWVFGDGRVVVRSHAAPPALLVTSSGSRLLPAAPESESSLVASDGDLLVMCSAEALGHLSAGLGGVLACSPLRVGAHDPDGLLEQLMAESDVGAAVIARCTDTHAAPHTSH